MRENKSCFRSCYTRRRRWDYYQIVRKRVIYKCLSRHNNISKFKLFHGKFTLTHPPAKSHPSLPKSDSYDGSFSPISIHITIISSSLVSNNSNQPTRSFYWHVKQHNMRSCWCNPFKKTFLSHIITCRLHSFFLNYNPSLLLIRHNKLSG